MSRRFVDTAYRMALIPLRDPRDFRKAREFFLRMNDLLEKSRTIETDGTISSLKCFECYVTNDDSVILTFS